MVVIVRYAIYDAEDNNLIGYKSNNLWNLSNHEFQAHVLSEKEINHNLLKEYVGILDNLNKDIPVKRKINIEEVFCSPKISTELISDFPTLRVLESFLVEQNSFGKYWVKP